VDMATEQKIVCQHCQERPAKVSTIKAKAPDGSDGELVFWLCDECRPLMEGIG